MALTEPPFMRTVAVDGSLRTGEDVATARIFSFPTEASEAVVLEELVPVEESVQSAGAPVEGFHVLPGMMPVGSAPVAEPWSERLRKVILLRVVTPTQTSGCYVPMLVDRQRRHGVHGPSWDRRDNRSSGVLRRHAGNK